MVEIDPITGLPKALGAWESIAKEDQEITIALESRKFGKKYTIVKGIRDLDITGLTKKLKSKLACGGTHKDGKIELQGNHASRVRDILVDMGFAPDTIVSK